MTIQELRKTVQDKLIKCNIEDASIKTDLLLEHVLDMTKTELLLKYNQIVNEDTKSRVNKSMLDIVNGKPIQYIINKQEFMGLEFYVDENVLIPQPDTEILVEEALKKINEMYEKDNEHEINKRKINDETSSKRVNDTKIIKILDLCTGSGAIAISIDTYIQKQIEQEKMKDLKVEIVATDISEKAIEVAKRNAKLHNANIKFIISDMFENINETDFDLIISNPPYIETKTIPTLSKEVQSEPYIALDGGEDGLDLYRIIAKQGFKYLNNKGCILLEIGYNQKESVRQVFKEYKEYKDVKCLKDLGGNDRLVEILVAKSE